MRESRRQPLLAALGLMLPLLLVAGIWLGGHPGDLPGFVRDALVADHDTLVVNEAIDEIVHDYYRPVSRAQLASSSIDGAVASLHDRFSGYMTPAEYKDFNHPERFSGVGITVTAAKRGLRVVQVFDNSPALRAGLRVGDVITAVDGRSLAGTSLDSSRQRITGKPGTDVELGYTRAGRAGRVRVTRATIDTPVVASHLSRSGGVPLADVALSEFIGGAHGQVRAAIDKQLKAGARGVLLDLRHNGGGLVEEARLVASIFIPRGTIVSTRGRAQPSQTLSAAGGAIAPRIPVAVLVDHETASASEIVTGALQDHHRARVVGTHTFGKGVFQEVRPLSNGGALRITVGEYFTPNGRNLGGRGVTQGAGISPDVNVAKGVDTSRGTGVALRTLAGQVRR